MTTPLQNYLSHSTTNLELNLCETSDVEYVTYHPYSRLQEDWCVDFHHLPVPGCESASDELLAVKHPNVFILKYPYVTL
jgi:hypothetical protein